MISLSNHRRKCYSERESLRPFEGKKFGQVCPGAEGLGEGTVSVVQLRLACRE